LLSACASAPKANKNPIAQWVPSKNFDARRPRLIVIHHTQISTAEEALSVLRNANSQGKVSAHYLIGDDGKIYQLVEDHQRAWHAGVSQWQGISDINSMSIGIELDNDGAEPFSDAQIQSLLRLLEDICKRFNIARDSIVAHADIAPTRKADPSALFPWKRLADAGFGWWYSEPLADAPPEFDAVAALANFGYDITDLPAAIRAFHRRFRGMQTDALDEMDRKILYHWQISQTKKSEPTQ
jgi:N-acetylmuramoyl-L-alanine amidase